MPHSILGLDVGSRTVKAVLLETTLRGFAVTGAVDAPLPDEAPAPPEGAGAPAAEAPAGAEGGAEARPPPGLVLRGRQGAAVRALLAARGWRPDGVVASVPGIAGSHLVTLPFADARRIEQTVQYEVEAAIPFDLEQVAWDWQVLDQQGGRSDLFVGVVRKEELAGVLAMFADAGADPAVVVPGAPTLAALWAAGAVEAPVAAGEAEVALEIGAERTHVCVVTEGRCLFARTFPVGAAAVERGGPAPLVRELRTTLRAFEARPTRRPVRRLVIAGGGAGIPGIDATLGEALGLPAAPLRLAGPAAAAIPPESAPALAMPLALALRGWMGNRFQRLNLRRGDLASTRGFEDVKHWAIRIGVYGGLVALLAVVSSGVTAVALTRQERLLDQALCDVTQKVVGKCYDDFSVAESVLRGRGTLGASIPKVSASGVLAELAARAPGVPLRLDRIEITRDKLHLQGTTDAAENVDRVVSALRASRCFADARSGGARKRGTEQKFEFTVDADLTCEGAPATPGGKG